MTRKQKKVCWRILITLVLLMLIRLLPVSESLKGLLFLIPYLVIGYDILRKAALGIRHGEVFDENFLMAVATVGALLLGEYGEGTAVMLFYQIGELFQSVAVGRSRRNISSLMDIRPDYANVERDGELVQVDPEEVEIGTEILVQPGERIPLDGVITEGSSSLDTVALTGESIPRDVKAGEEVFSGCVNLSGLLRIRTTKAAEESTVARILDMVENSAMKKSRAENFITKFAKYYTPAVCFAALALAVLPPIICLAAGANPNWSSWVVRALTFLVISCPCALVISIPLSFFGGIGGASTAGILVKGSNYLEALSRTRCVVFDKTGTLTEGVFRVTQICPAASGISEQATEDEASKKQEAAEFLLKTAAYAEGYSHHPISKSLKEAYGQEIDRSLIAQTEEISGFGVTAVVDGHAVAVGNAGLMERVGCQAEQTDAAGTMIHVALDGRYLGYLLISDVIKSQTVRAVEQLKLLGVTRTVMLTGDRERVAREIAAGAGIGEVRAELLPSDKVAEVETLLEQKRPRETCVYVGDGINDAPVLSRADVGIAMGALGADAAIEAADVVLMDDNPMRIAQAIRIAKKCMRIVYQNIIFALGVKALCLVLGALGYANMWLAIFADVGVMVIAVLNAMRCLQVKRTAL